MKKFTTILILLLSFAVFGQSSTEFKNTQGNCDASLQSTSITGGRQCSANFDWTCAVDLIVPADNNLTLNSITPSFGMMTGVTATSVLVTIYNNANGVPGNSVDSQTIIPTSHTFKGSQFGMDFSDVLLELDPVTLSGSAGSEINYWIALQITTSNDTDGYLEQTAELVVGNPLAFSSGAGFIIPEAFKDGVYSLTADCEPMSGDLFPAPYCGPIIFGTVEPISRVVVAGIDNDSSATLNGSPAHQDFVAIMGEMEQGNVYSIALEGNTVGDFTNRFVVFIDWNQNNILDDEGEVYSIDEPLINSTGRDGLQAVGEIAVPENAVLGNTRMRVKKTYDQPYFDPCDSESNWGQAEDYTITVVENLGVAGNDNLFGFSFYPNPSLNLVNLHSNENIESVSIYNLLGQKVLSIKIGTSSLSLDISGLSSGTYVMKVNVQDQVGTYKLIKR